MLITRVLNKSQHDDKSAGLNTKRTPRFDVGACRMVVDETSRASQLDAVDGVRGIDLEPVALREEGRSDRGPISSRPRPRVLLKKELTTGCASAMCLRSHASEVLVPNPRGAQKRVKETHARHDPAAFSMVKS